MQDPNDHSDVNQIQAEIDVINASWEVGGESNGLADSIGLMVYEGTQVIIFSIILTIIFTEDSSASSSTKPLHFYRLWISILLLLLLRLFKKSLLTGVAPPTTREPPDPLGAFPCIPHIGQHSTNNLNI